MIITGRIKPWFCWQCDGSVAGRQHIGEDGWPRCGQCAGACTCCDQMQCNCEIATIGNDVDCLSCNRTISNSTL